MPYSVEYFHPRVKVEVESWPVGILADYARMVELVIEFGPTLRMPHSRALGGGLFELRPGGPEGAGRAVLLCDRQPDRHSARLREEAAAHADA